MFERFTDRARKVMALANQEGLRFNHEYIGTEHILLGLVREGSGVGANVLKNFGVNPRNVRQDIEKLVKTGSETVTTGKLPQTPRGKKVIEYAIEEARALNHNYVGTEHLLLGLLREEDGIAAQVLKNLGLQLDTVREEVLKQLGQGDAPKEIPAALRSSGPSIPVSDRFLALPSASRRPRLRRGLSLAATWLPLAAVLFLWLVSPHEVLIERKTLDAGGLSAWVECRSRVKIAAIGVGNADRTSYGLMLQPHRLSVWRSDEVPLTTNTIAETSAFGPITLHRDPMVFLSQQPPLCPLLFPIAVRLSAPFWLLSAVFAIPPLISLIRGPLRRYHRRRHGRCLNCAYDLRGSPGPRCPECGAHTDWFGKERR